MPPSPHPVAPIQIRLAREADLAVVVVRHGYRYSRMFRWDLRTDVFWPGQWLAAWIDLLDLSPDGRYVAYAAANPRRMIPSYLAVSRPPYLTALFFQPARADEIRTAAFRSAEAFDWFGTLFSAWHLGSRPDPVERRVEPGCPFRITRNFEPADLQPPSDPVQDARGRVIRTHEGRVYVDDVEMLDLRELGRPNLAAPEEMRRW